MSGPAHSFHPTLLREYDIRGIVGSTLHPADARAIGHAFGTMVAAAGGRKVVLGYDGRLSSPELAAATGASVEQPVRTREQHAIEGFTAVHLELVSTSG